MKHTLFILLLPLVGCATAQPETSRELLSFDTLYTACVAHPEVLTPRVGWASQWPVELLELSAGEDGVRRCERDAADAAQP